MHSELEATDSTRLWHFKAILDYLLNRPLSIIPHKLYAVEHVALSAPDFSDFQVLENFCGHVVQLGERRGKSIHRRESFQVRDVYRFVFGEG